MTSWILSTAFPIYNLIENGKKTYDTRAPDPTNPQKRLDQAKKGDIAVIIPALSSVSEPLDSSVFPTLKYEISDIQHFPPNKNEEWESVAKRTLEHIGLEKIFPNHSLEKAIEVYRSFPNYPQRIKDYGLVAIGLGRRL